MTILFSDGFQSSWPANQNVYLTLVKGGAVKLYAHFVTADRSASHSSGF